MGRRIAIADLGSNTLKLSVTDVGTDGRHRVVDAAAHTVRLSAGIADTGMIEPARIDRAIDVLRSYEQHARQLGAVTFRGVATAAVRMATNGGALIGRIEAETAWSVRIISGEEEARLTFLGLVGDLPSRGTCVIADIGGASTELIRVLDRTPLLSESVQIGSGTLADQTFRADPPGVEAVGVAQQVATKTLEHAPALAGSGVDALYLAGGNGVFLSQFASWDRVRLPFVPPFLRSIVESLAVIPAVDVAAFLGIVEERARMLPAGGAIALALVEIVRPKTLVAVPSGIRGGLVHEWIEAGLPEDRGAT